MKKAILVFSLLGIFTTLIHAQPSTAALIKKYKKHIKKVKEFNSEEIIEVLETATSDYWSPKEVDVKNKNNDVLRFKIKNDTIIPYHGGICFIQYKLDKGWISEQTTYGENGKIKGEIEFKDMAVQKFKIINIQKLREKMDKINEADGNLQTHDEDEKIILQTILNSKREVVEEKYMSTSDYWIKKNLGDRP